MYSLVVPLHYVDTTPYLLSIVDFIELSCNFNYTQIQLFMSRLNILDNLVEAL
jgi:hypothetical protein